MSKRYLIVEMVKIQPVKFHLVEISSNPLEAYNQNRSLDAFRKQGKASPNAVYTLGHWFRVWAWEDIRSLKLFGLDMTIKEYINTTMEGSSKFEPHKSLWDFYNAIGYDYKKQKWTI